mgnify:CR=1 FL=1
MEFLHALVVSLLLGSPGPGAPPRFVPAHSHPEAAAMDSVTATLRAPETTASGVPVALTLVVENTGSEPAVLYVTGRPPAVDVRVEDAEGRLVWRRLEGETVSMVLQVLRLAPGERREFDVEWDQRDEHGRPVPPGLYRVRGALLTEGGGSLTTDPEVLRIEPRGGDPNPGR